MKKSSILILICCLFTSFLFAEKSVSYNNQPLDIYTLENGLTLFVIHDETIPLVHTEFVCKAGISDQTKDNQGFFTLYANIINSKYEDLQVSCNADCTKYVNDVAIEDLENHLNKLCSIFSNMNFSDKEIKTEYTLMKAQVENYSQSVAGFINGAIDSRVFADSPWKTDSGIYPSLFNSYSFGELRTVLMEIGKSYYSPKNCGLFICTNIESEEVYQLASKCFSNWNMNFQEKDREILNQNNSSQKRYVIVDDSFSDEMSQLVIQFVNLSMSSADILASSYNSTNSPLVNNVFKKGNFNIRDEDYIGISSAHKSSCSRLIIQTLIEEPVKVPLVTQTLNFTNACKESARLTDRQFEIAKNQIEAKYKNTLASSVTFASTISDYWALTSVQTTKDFNTTFENFLNSIKNDSPSNIYSQVKKQEPFVFVLVNTKIYNKNKKDFEKENFEVITQKNGSWYKTQVDAKALLENKSKNLELKEDFFALDYKKYNDKFYSDNLDSIKKLTLSNEIEVVVKEIQGETATICFAIKGGEKESPANEKGLRTVLINAFASNIQHEISSLKNVGRLSGNTQIKAWTKETCSYILINCLKEDIQLTIQAAFNAIVYSELSPIDCDALISEQSYQFKLRNIALSNQLKNNGMEYLYRQTSNQGIFTDTIPLKNTDYNSICASYNDLLDASLYSIVIVGDVKSSDLEKSFKDNFELLHKLNPRSGAVIETPKFKNKTRAVQVNHVFTTNKSAESAPKESPYLIPTKVFYDPVQFYFPSPTTSQEIVIFNAIFNQFCKMLNEYPQLNNDVSYFEASKIFQVGILEADKVKSVTAFTLCYDSCRTKFYNSLKNNDEELLNQIKSAWKKQYLYNLQTTEGTAKILSESLTDESELLFLENYQIISELDLTTVISIFEKYVPKEIPFKVFSTDGEK